ncbi:copper resistance D family protein [Fictibacillus phosphorivorans]|uniref:copper resistance D family protein n=1 Tax=Fictibacillus phosphorivorans TaxID=1221500 RepID=UPI00203F3586|nr:CopD family protein [Fictibacillus phosphorivorans]MCM3718192.1 CopD family protein [Fictibacillus phosphorivorans]MCM3775941.1 CopD family protein [Fictibacillus phosphorivorans]
MFIVAKAMLYLCFSILIGACILYSVPITKRPEICIKKSWLLLLVAVVPIFGIGELMRLTLYLGEGIGYWLTFQNIIFSFELGKGWLFLTGITVLLFFMILFNDIGKERFFAGLSLFLLTGMALSIGYASHAASLDSFGIVAHSLHFLAVTAWSGTLLTVGFFSKGEGPGVAFYKWFTPFALMCLFIVIGAGLWLMSYIVPEYVNGYMLNYGQALLIKHVLLFVVIFYSVINGIWLKKKRLSGEGSLSIKRWIKVEGILLFFVFAATAVMSQQTPPHDVAQTLKMEKPSSLFSLITGLNPGENPMLKIDLSLLSFGWLFACIVLLAGVFMGIKRKIGFLPVFIVSILAAGSLYLAVMSSLSL